MEKISPTRMNLLILKQRVMTTQKGIKLLESKREALAKEFFQLVETVVTTRETLRFALQGAKNALILSSAIEGFERLSSLAFAASRNLSIELSEKNIWGVRFPDLNFHTVVLPLDARGYSFTGSSPHVVHTIRQFEEVVDHVLKTISAEMKIKRIGLEIKKLTRRINALKEAILPPLRAQIREIKTRVDEREHEDIFRIKRFKGKLAV